jgi:hypothetical protein
MTKPDHSQVPTQGTESEGIVPEPRKRDLDTEKSARKKTKSEENLKHAIEWTILTVVIILLMCGREILSNGYRRARWGGSESPAEPTEVSSSPEWLDQIIDGPILSLLFHGAIGWDMVLMTLIFLLFPVVAYFTGRLSLSLWRRILSRSASSSHEVPKGPPEE